MKYGEFRVSFGTWFSIRKVVAVSWLSQMGINMQTKAWWSEQYKFKSNFRFWINVVNAAYAGYLLTQIFFYAYEGSILHDKLEVNVAFAYGVALMWFGFWFIEQMQRSELIKVTREMAKCADLEISELRAQIRYLNTLGK